MLEELCPSQAIPALPSKAPWLWSTCYMDYPVMASNVRLIYFLLRRPTCCQRISSTRSSQNTRLQCSGIEMLLCCFPVLGYHALLEGEVQNVILRPTAFTVIDLYQSVQSSMNHFGAPQHFLSQKHRPPLQVTTARVTGEVIGANALTMKP